MPTTTDIQERLLSLEEQRRAGKNPSAADLCRDRPELLARLEKEMHKLAQMDELLSPDPAPDASAAGTGDPAEWQPLADRYEKLRKLGEGGQGVVYEVREITTGRIVALKIMKRADPAALERFIRECRALQEMNHPNLVTLFEVGVAGPYRYFTMELVEGVSFLEHLDKSQASDETLNFGNDSGTLGSEEAVPSMSPMAQSRLRDAFRQLARGISALHQCNILHRDIKPSNAPITKEGRVILLDFGLATGSMVDDRSITREGGGAGTIAYMAPEQADGHASMASDWYSFGVMLYEALAGRNPFRDTPHAMPWKRKEHNPQPPHLSSPEIPQDLSVLCADLLRASPASRPDGREVHRRLSLDPAEVKTATPRTVFVGREAELESLRAACSHVAGGKTSVVLLHGESGLGKSALVRHFLGRLRQEEPGTVTLAGRCYERELVPYKALDGLVASLSRYWRRLPPEQAARLVPGEVGPLTLVFPVLQAVEPVKKALQEQQEILDPHESRRRAVCALREVLVPIGRRRESRLVLWLDDLQWGDEDSAAMLIDLLTPSDQPSPRLLLLAGFRTQDRGTSPFLTTFLNALEKLQPIAVIDLPLEPLAPATARMLAGQLLEDNEQSSATVESVARESAGNPFFIYQLVQNVQDGAAEVSLDHLIHQRVAALPEDHQRLLKVIALASRPLPRSVALRAAPLRSDPHKALIDLQAARLLRGGSAPAQELETYHDRIRETLISALEPAERTKLHLALAAALTLENCSDAEQLAVHYEGAGDPKQAAKYYADAGEQAARLLAFDRAAQLYQMALTLDSSDPAKASRLYRQLGEALSNVGRSANAADAFLKALPGADPRQAQLLQRRAADQYLRAGHLNEGIAAIRRALEQVNLSYPDSRRRVFWGFLFNRLRIWWRGLGFRERSPAEITPEELAQADACHSAAILSLADTLRGLYFQSKFLLLTQRLGEPARRAMALAFEATYQSTHGGRNQARVEAILQMARDLAERSQDPYARNLIELNVSAAMLMLGQWRRSVEAGEKAEAAFRTQHGVAWEIGTTSHYRLTALTALGEWKRVANELPRYINEARQRGDRYTETTLLVHSVKAHIAADEPEAAASCLAEAMRLWPFQDFHLQHYHALLVETELALYRGDKQNAWELVCGRWPRLQASSLLRVQLIRVYTVFLRARAALALATLPEKERPGYPTKMLLQAARRDAKALGREGVAWPRAYGMLVEAGIAALTKDTKSVMDRLHASGGLFAEAEVPIYQAAASYRMGQVLGGETGRGMVQKAREVLQQQGIRNPERQMEVLAPASST